MKTSEKYSVGDLVIIPPYTPAVVEDPDTHQLVDFVTAENDQNFGIITNITETSEYGEITVLCGNNLVYLPAIRQRPGLVVLEGVKC